MCGICGELRFDNTSPDTAAIRRMSEKLARRGPDHEGLIGDGPLAFGHRRLAIIDLSPSADQPGRVCMILCPRGNTFANIVGTKAHPPSMAWKLIQNITTPHKYKQSQRGNHSVDRSTLQLRSRQAFSPY